MLTETNLLDLLKEKGVKFEIYNHEPLFTVEDSEKLRGKIDGFHTKNLFLKNKKGEFFLFSCEENARVNLKFFSKSIEAKNLSFANENYLKKYLGIEPGSVSPYALLNDKENKVNFYLDEMLFKSETINYHPLINTTTISVKTKEFLNFILENKKKINIFSLESYSIVKTYE
ncbi:prolyl-tRNA synthetase associated domain-containing protein [Pelagibacteraceae bacterium]|nr:prolyl-tRNA synthetase associated domain-containing protein [Pelagibacteraceae bacterium]